MRISQKDGDEYIRGLRNIFFDMIQISTNISTEPGYAVIIGTVYTIYPSNRAKLTQLVAKYNYPFNERHHEAGINLILGKMPEDE